MYQKYLAEGEKIVSELIEFNPVLIDQLFALPDFIKRNEEKMIAAGIQFFSVNAKEIERISNLKTPQNVLAVVRMPEEKNGNIQKDGLTKVMYLDDVRDPGNLGTIIRSADWFGWELVVLSPDCVDPYNPKVVQATMGSLFRLSIIQKGLKEFLDETQVPFVIYSAVMNGKSIYEEEVKFPLLLIMGNESHGVMVAPQQYQVNKVSIPGYNRQTESLNVAVACSVLLAEINRKSLH